MTKPMPITEFMKLFPNDDACLEHLFKERFGNGYECTRCGEAGKFKKLSAMPAYTCQCGNHVHPMMGTPFKKSHVPLQKWFYALYLFTTTRHGVSAKELQRQLSVNYKTAWRMGHEIRKYLAFVDGHGTMSGEVEIDETYFGGRRKGKRGRGAGGKAIIVAMQSRGGDIKTAIVPNVTKPVMQKLIVENVDQGSTVHTDEFPSYVGLDAKGYEHQTCDHKHKKYSIKGSHVNHTEGFFGLLKRSIQGTHIQVSHRHLPKYLGEFEFRWNLRHDAAGMFPLLLRRLATSPKVA